MALASLLTGAVVVAVLMVVVTMMTTPGAVWPVVAARRRVDAHVQRVRPVTCGDRGQGSVEGHAGSRGVSREGL